jgi:DNA helicase II / ATP-dependent DNA helicase PcrA
VSLLTLHATKGLEFSRVYIVGVEDSQIPGAYALEHDEWTEIQEARRLLYVGMTRAKDRLVLTRSTQREGRSTGGDLFLREAGLVTTVLD